MGNVLQVLRKWISSFSKPATSSEEVIRRPPTTELHSQSIPITFSEYNPQLQSRLFNKISPEIRNIIFQLATQPYDDRSNVYNTTDFYYRPGHRARNKTCTALLRTCRLIWSETNGLPLHQTTPTFWFKDEDRRPPWTRGETRWQVQIPKFLNLQRKPDGPVPEETRFENFFRKLPRQATVQSVQIFAQMYWLQNWNASQLFTRTFLLRNVQRTRKAPPKTVVITIRHTDWWWWEEDAPLELNDKCHWIKGLLQSTPFEYVQTFVLEMETISGKVDQLKAMVELVRSHQSCVRSREAWVGDFEVDEQSGREEIMRWTGRANIGGKRREVYGSAKELEYVVYSLVWKRNKGVLEDSQSLRDGSLMGDVSPKTSD